MTTYKYVKYCDFDRIIREDDLHYIILDETDYRVRRGLHQNLFTCWNCDLQHSQG